MTTFDELSQDQRAALVLGETPVLVEGRDGVFFGWTDTRRVRVNIDGGRHRSYQAPKVKLAEPKKALLEP